MCVCGGGTKQKTTEKHPTKQNSHQLSFWCLKPIKLKQYLTMPSTYGDVPSSTDHTFNRHSLHSISHTITIFNQFHRNVTRQRSSYSIPIQKHYSNFWVIQSCKKRNPKGRTESTHLKFSRQVLKHIILRILIKIP